MSVMMFKCLDTLILNAHGKPLQYAKIPFCFVFCTTHTGTLYLHFSVHVVYFHPENRLKLLFEITICNSRTVLCAFSSTMFITKNYIKLVVNILLVLFFGSGGDILLYFHPKTVYNYFLNLHYAIVVHCCVHFKYFVCNQKLHKSFLKYIISFIFWLKWRHIVVCFHAENSLQLLF